MAPVVMDSSEVRAETPPPRRRQSAGASPKTSGGGSDEWTRSPLSRPRHPAAFRAGDAGDFSAPKPRRVDDEAFLSPMPSRSTPFAEANAEDCLLSPGRPAGKENLPLSPMRAPPRQPRTPGPRTPMPTVREHDRLAAGAVELQPDLSQWTPVPSPAPMDPTEAWERGLLRSPAPPGLPEPSVRNTFITFESPLRADRPRSPPKSVPANCAFGGVEPDWWGLASPPSQLFASQPPVWPPCTPEPQQFGTRDSQPTPEAVALPLRLSDFLPGLPAMPSMPSSAGDVLSMDSMPPPPVFPQPTPTASATPTPSVASAQIPSAVCPSAPSDEKEQRGDCSQVAVTCAEAVMTNEEVEGGEHSDAAVRPQKCYQVLPPAQMQGSGFLPDQLQLTHPSQPAQPQAFNLDAMLNAQFQPAWGQEHQMQQQFAGHAQLEFSQQMMQQMEFVPLQDQHQHFPGQMQHEISQPMQQMFSEGVEMQPEMPLYAQQQTQDRMQHMFPDIAQQMLQQHISQQQMPQQVHQQMQGSMQHQIPQQIPQQMHDPAQLIQDQIQQLQQMQHQMQQQEMQHQLQQHVHHQMEQQMQQQMQQQHLQEQTQQMFHMLQHQLSQAQPPPSHLTPSGLPPAQVKLSELLQLPPMPTTDVRGDSVSASFSSWPAGRPEDSVAATPMDIEAPEIAERWADEPVIPAQNDGHVFREMNDTESPPAPGSAPRTGRRGRNGPRSSGRR